MRLPALPPKVMLALESSVVLDDVADNSSDGQIRIVEGSAKGMPKDVAQITSFMDGTRGGCTHMTWDTTGSGELAKQVPHPFTVLCNLRIDLGIGPFEVHIGEDRRSTMTRSCQVDHIDILVLDESI